LQVNQSRIRKSKLYASSWGNQAQAQIPVTLSDIIAKVTAANKNRIRVWSAQDDIFILSPG